MRLCSIEDETLLAHLSGWCRARRKLARRLARQAEEATAAGTSAPGGAAGDAAAPEAPVAENVAAPAGSATTK